jgi:protein-disulfide isomerase
MPISELRRSSPARVWLALAAVLIAFASSLSAQVPTTGQPQQMPSPEQAQSLLKAQPELVQQLRDRLSRSGLTPDQIRSRLRAAGYPENMLDD